MRPNPGSSQGRLPAHNNSWNEIVACEENDGESLLTKAAVHHIEMATAPENASRPFFIAMGHHKPHLPWEVPSRFYEQYGDPRNVAVAELQQYPESAPTISWYVTFRPNSTVLTVLSWIHLGMHSRRALPCPVCA